MYPSGRTTRLPGRGFTRPASLVMFLLLMVVAACGGKPPESIFTDNIDKMVLIDRELGFDEEVTAIQVVDVVKHPNQVEVTVRVEGHAVHPEVTMGAVLPARPDRRGGWAIWKFYCVKKDDEWEIAEKYKVKEGFDQ